MFGEKQRERAKEKYRQIEREKEIVELTLSERGSTISGKYEISLFMS